MITLSQKSYFCKSNQFKVNMKKNNNFLKIAVLVISALSLFGCRKHEDISLSLSDLWFPKDAGVKEIQLTANCKWSIEIDDAADWYSIEPMTGEGNSVLYITVQSLGELEQRTSSFTINSARGKVQLKVSVMQNTQDPLELLSITNLVFGVSNLAHWNTDYAGEVIDDSYEYYEFDPYDTLSGYIMYFFENGEGVQKDNHDDSSVYYYFNYDYDPAIRNLHLEFETVNGLPDVYDATILSASMELFSFQHEYKKNYWERTEMMKIGSINPVTKSLLKHKTSKRKERGSIFLF